MNNGATAAMAAATAVVKSILNKPLHELTEDDISQLTREDCRRYLKEKGMRRPSWNKSQAIQQVISLKSLLEPTPPRPPPVAAAAARAPEIPATTSTTVTSSSSSSIKELSAADVDGPVVALAEDGSLNQLPGPSGSDPVREGDYLPAAADSEPLPVRSANAPDLPTGQMTIFYSGKVNVYDGVPVDKQAHAIMHVASSPIQFFQDETTGGNSTHWSTPCQLLASSVKFNVAPPDTTIVQSVLSDVDSQTNRQVSLQRYFEKRKDRGKFKLKRKIRSSGLEMYLNHQMRMPVAGTQPTQSNSSSPDQVGISCAGYASADKQLKNSGLSVDLNDKA